MDDTPAPEPNPADLERSYQQVLHEQAWQLDVGESPEAMLPGERPGEQDATVPSRSPVRAPPPAAAPPPVARIVEALLFVGGLPLTAERAAEAIRGLTNEQFHAILDELNRAYREQGRPYVTQRQEQGHVLALRPGYRFVVEKFQAGVREARLSAAAVDVLAIVAYRQPATRREVESLRGHDSGLVLRQLLRRGLIAVASRGESGGREVQYATTQRFLDLFGLSGLDDLPQTEDLQRL